LTRPLNMPMLWDVASVQTPATEVHEALAEVPVTAGGGPHLSDLMALPALAGTRVDPPDAPLTARVQAVTVGGEGAPAEPGAVVLAAEPSAADLPKGCVAVVCRAPLDDLGVPALILKPGAPWGPVVAEISAAVAAAAGSGPAAAVRQALRAPLVEGQGYSALAGVAQDFLGVGVACLDEYLDTLGSAGLKPGDEADLAAAVERARNHGPASVVGSFFADEEFVVCRERVIGRGGTVGVVVVWLASALTASQAAVVGELAEACAIERARDEARTETEARLRGDLLEELRAGEIMSPESIVRRARHVGTDLANGAVALVGRLEDPHDQGRLITEPRLVRRFLQQTRAVLDLHCPGALVDWDAGKLLVLLPPEPGAEGTAIDERAQLVARRLIGATSQAVPGVALSLALSRHTPDPERLGAALDEAELACSIGERLGRIGEVVTFEETGTYKLLFQLFADRPGELSSFYDQTIAPLVAYDEQYGTELVGTLATYLENDANLAGTAGHLFTHRHTVRYRLDRVAELSGLDVAKTDDREKLSLGLKAMRLLGKKIPTPPGVERPRSARKTAPPRG
jgi:sugar diacid utilization regulator